LLQLIFSLFLGLMVLAFVGIGVNTSYPGPREPDYPIGFEGKEPPPAFQAAMQQFRHAWEHWALHTSILLLICATLVMAVSLIRSERLPVVSNGVLLGGVFTMVYAVGMTLSSGQSWLRFVVAAVALTATVAVGMAKFVRRTAAEGAAAPAHTAAPAPSALEQRVTALETRLDAIARAWSEPPR
jgi:hypothetical protein